MRIYITRKIPQNAVQMLADEGFRVDVWQGERPPPRDVLLREAAASDGLLTMLSDTVDEELLTAAPKLKVVSNFAVGYDNFDVPAMRARSVQMGITPDVHTETTADTAFTLLMAAARRVRTANHDVHAGNWHTWEPLGWLGIDIHHATLGVIGFGRIGQAVARRGTGFNMRLLYHNRTPKPTEAAALGAEYRELDALLQEADFISLNLPLSAETYHMIGERELALMKPNAVLINTGRGGLVDPSALYVALRAKMIFAAALDVTEPEPLPADHPLLTLENCLVLPHIGSATIAAREGIARRAAENLIAGLKGLPLPYPVPS